ncbi:ABC transporter ATP-binding protein/permease [Methylobacterium sp. W2]|uniref:ABC transporter ATP-binding protein/permease n=1 Tax=Methylobacterium sp. W2 TaxID=2598107 RepID=UPI001D0C223B|nr:SbmA/BacA-like family transporter [Methylobacterium sp. W2]MCC0808477.1 ABC transporter ATP-binding protein/permease [Methylobacterium sp. W2]
MIIIASAMACLGLLTCLVADQAVRPDLYIVAGFVAAAAAAVGWSGGLSIYLKIILRFFAIETLVFGLCACADAAGLWPESLAGLRVPASLVGSVAIFSILVHLVTRIAIVRRAMTVVDRYFRNDDRLKIRFVGALRERSVAATLLALSILFVQLRVFFSIQLLLLFSSTSDAMMTGDSATYWRTLLWDLPVLLVPFMISETIDYYTTQHLAFRWRNWLTTDYADRWLGSDAHYRLSLGELEADNPDQRIQEDIPRFINGGLHGGHGVHSLTIALISQVSSLSAYTIILWGLSAKVTDTIPVPGFFFWIALLYAIVSTAGMLIAGRRLPVLAFERQHMEADYRFGLSRLREYGEQIALMKGAPTELQLMAGKFGLVRANFYALTRVNTLIDFFRSLFERTNVYIPHIVIGAFFFTKQITLGEAGQVSNAFFAVTMGLSFLISAFPAMAELKSVLDRLTSFDTALSVVHRPMGGTVTTGEADAITLTNAEIRLPDGTILSRMPSLRLAAGENALITGPSGTGKSTLFRVLAGIWPSWSGTLTRPRDADILVLPQKSYLPSGTLLTAVSYPRPAGAYDDDAVVEALQDVGLGHLAPDLDRDDIWAQRLSGGEQQRLAIARAILSRPAWLFLDEATAALDDAFEQQIYAALARRLPETTLISIGHRESLTAFHPRRIALKPSLDPALDAPRDGRQAAESARTVAAE